jgi:hypothetical protein
MEMRGVYCVNVIIKAVPLSNTSRLGIIIKEETKIPVALDENLKPLDENFTKKYLKVKDPSKYRVTYSMDVLKYMSNINY